MEENLEIKVLSRSEAQKASYDICVPAIIISITDISTNSNTFATNQNIYSILNLKFNNITYINTATNIKNEGLLLPSDCLNFKRKER
jgi:hypothetical protein